MNDQRQLDKDRKFRFREVVSDLRFDYYCRVIKSGLSVAEAVTQGKILPIMLFYRCFMEWKKQLIFYQFEAVW